MAQRKADGRWSGSQVRMLRMQLGMTQEDFAHQIGATVSTVNRWEKGHVIPSRMASRVLTQMARRTAGEWLVPG